MRRRSCFIVILGLAAAAGIAAYGLFIYDPDKLTDEKVEDAWNALYLGDGEPAKALTCLEAQSGLDTIVERTSQFPEGMEVSAVCDVFDDHMVCDVGLVFPDQSIATEFAVHEVVDGQVCLPTED